MSDRSDDHDTIERDFLDGRISFVEASNRLEEIGYDRDIADITVKAWQDEAMNLTGPAASATPRSD